MKLIGPCPNCGHLLYYSDDVEYTDSFTTDCPECNKLLLCEDGSLYDFHKKMHKEYSKWPEDGKGTFSVTVQEDRYFTEWEMP